MNKRLFRTQFNQMENIEKQVLMESLAARYDMTFLGLHTFDRWGQSCTTGIFKKDGREFVFVPGDTVTLGWEQFAVGLNQESREELEYLFREWEMERDPEEMIRESMAPVRQVAIGPMLVGRELEEINWEPVKLEDPRLRSEWLEDFRQFALTDRDSLTLVGRARFERDGDSWQVSLYHEVDYLDFQNRLQKQGFSLPQCQVMNSKKTSTIQRKTSFMVSAYFVFDSFSCDTFNLGCKKAGDLFGSPA